MKKLSEDLFQEFFGVLGRYAVSAGEVFFCLGKKGIDLFVGHAKYPGEGVDVMRVLFDGKFGTCKKCIYLFFQALPDICFASHERILFVDFMFLEMH